MAYETFQPRQFPGQLRDGRLGYRYEIVFTAPPIVERDSVIVDELDPALIDKLIREKIAKHEAIAKLGK